MTTITLTSIGNNHDNDNQECATMTWIIKELIILGLKNTILESRRNAQSARK